MYARREEKVSELKEEIEQGSYTVDPKAVADAIVTRLRVFAEAASTNATSPVRG